MRSRSVRLASVGSTVVILGLLTAACGDTGGATSTTDAQEASTTQGAIAGSTTSGDSTSESEGLGGQVRVSFLGGADLQPYIDELESGFEELHPNVDLVLELPAVDSYRNSLTTQAQGGSPPDVAQVATSWLAAFAEADMLRNWEETYSSELLDAYIPNMLNGGRYGDELAGLPYGASVRGAFYNVSVFEEAGVQPPSNWEEMVEVTRTIAAGTDAIPFFYPGAGVENMAAFFPYVYFTHGGQLLDPDGNLHIDYQACVDGLSVWDTMNQEGLFEPNVTTGTGDQQYDSMTSGTAGMTISGPWVIGRYAQNAPDREFGVFPIPDGSTSATLGVTDAFIFFRDSQNPEAAQAFIEYVMEPERNLEYVQLRGFLPVYEEHLSEAVFNEEPLATFANGLDEAQFLPLHPDWPLLDEVGTEAITLMFLDGTGAEKACQDMVDGVSEINS